MAVKKSGLLLFLYQLHRHEVDAIGFMKALFSLYGSPDPLTVRDIYTIRSGYRKKSMLTLCKLNWVELALTARQQAKDSRSKVPSGYRLTAKGRQQVERLVAREAPDIKDRGHLLRWLHLIQNHDISTFTELWCVVQIDENPGLIAKELFNYRSGSTNQLFDRLESQGLIVQEFVEARKEKFPGDAWNRLRSYLNKPIPSDILGYVTSSDGT